MAEYIVLHLRATMSQQAKTDAVWERGRLSCAKRAVSWKVLLQLGLGWSWKSSLWFGKSTVLDSLPLVGGQKGPLHLAREEDHCFSGLNSLEEKEEIPHTGPQWQHEATGIGPHKAWFSQHLHKFWLPYFRQSKSTSSCRPQPKKNGPEPVLYIVTKSSLFYSPGCRAQRSGPACQ